MYNIYTTIFEKHVLPLHGWISDFEKGGADYEVHYPMQQNTHF